MPAAAPSPPEAAAMRKPPGKHTLKAEINVVPYIDVMLVLLVIFMVTAPMLTQGVAIDLPKVESDTLPTDVQQQILTLSVKADGSYYWNLGSEVNTERQTDSAVDLTEMTAKIQRLAAEREDLQVYVRADQSADYATVVAAIAALQRGGVSRLGLITEPPP
jgi:biopolymer transport protein TolR